MNYIIKFLTIKSSLNSWNFTLGYGVFFWYLNVLIFINILDIRLCIWIFNLGIFTSVFLWDTGVLFFLFCKVLLTFHATVLAFLHCCALKSLNHIEVTTGILTEVPHEYVLNWCVPRKALCQSLVYFSGN